MAITLFRTKRTKIYLILIAMLFLMPILLILMLYQYRIYPGYPGLLILLEKRQINRIYNNIDCNTDKETIMYLAGTDIWGK